VQTYKIGMRADLQDRHACRFLSCNHLNQVIGLDTSFFHPLRLSMEHREWISINDPPQTEVCLIFKLEYVCEELILTLRAGHDWDLKL